MENNYFNKYLNKNFNKKIKTFQTDEKIYNSFKKTCTQLDKQVGYVLTEMMDLYNENHELHKEFFEKSAKIDNSDPPELFTHDSLWNLYMLNANTQVCLKIIIRLQCLESLAKRWLDASKKTDEYAANKIKKENESGLSDFF